MSSDAAPDPLETERLRLRPSVEDDAVIFRQLWTERDPRVPPHRRIGADGRPTVQDVAVHLRESATQSGPRLLTVELKDSAEVIGYCGLITSGHGSAEEPELAYELMRAAHGCGYATEATGAVVGWARARGYRRLTAGVWDWNVASRRVLTKLGFRETGPDGQESDHGQSLITVLDL